MFLERENAEKAVIFVGGGGCIDLCDNDGHVLFYTHGRDERG